MIVDERLVTYINSLDRGNTPVLDEIEKEALRDFVPIIRKEMQSFLKLLDFTPEQIAEFLALAAELKAKKKASELTEDEVKDGEKKIQDLTDKFVAEIDKMVAEKDKEIMSI